MPVKQLKFIDKENKDDDTHSTKKSEIEKNNISGYTPTLRNEKEILAQEIVNLNREISKIKVFYFRVCLNLLFIFDRQKTD